MNKIDNIKEQVSDWFNKKRLKFKLYPLIKPIPKKEMAAEPLFAPFLLIHLYQQKRFDLFKYWVQEIYGDKDGKVPVQTKKDRLVEYNSRMHKIVQHGYLEKDLGKSGLALVLDYLATYNVYVSFNSGSQDISQIYLLEPDKVVEFDLSLEYATMNYDQSKLRLYLNKGCIDFISRIAFGEPKDDSDAGEFYSNESLCDVDLYNYCSERLHQHDWMSEYEIFGKILSLIDKESDANKTKVVQFLIDNNLAKQFFSNDENLFENLLLQANDIQQATLIAAITDFRFENIYLYTSSNKIDFREGGIRLPDLIKDLEFIHTQEPVETLDLPEV